MKPSSRRVLLLDEIRGLDIILMVGHHLLYTVGYMFGIGWARWLFDALGVIAPFFAAQFIFISGIACHLSHNNLRRGIWLLLIALGMTGLLYAFMPHSVIWFGVLHLLAVCILLYTLLRRAIAHVPAWLGILLCAVLFLLTWWLPPDKGGFFGIAGVFAWHVPDAVQAIPWLFPLGLAHGSSADYFPLLPWVFCFFAGAFCGRYRFPKWTYRSHIPFLAATGRVSLFVYLLHQPIIFGVGTLINQIF